MAAMNSTVPPEVVGYIALALGTLLILAAVGVIQSDIVSLGVGGLAGGLLERAQRILKNTRDMNTADG